MIVVLEGIDASGKATQSKRLAQRLQEKGVKSERFDFPRYQSLTGEAILSLLKREWWCVQQGEERREHALQMNGGATVDLEKVVFEHFFQGSSVSMPAEYVHIALSGTRKAPTKDDKRIALVLQMLMTVNRYEHIEKLKEYESPSDGVLVLDRYYGSGIAYGEADGLDGAFLRTIHRALPPADLWVFVDIDPKESVRRRPDRRDEYETRAGFMHKVRERYLDLFNHPSMPGQWVVVDGMGSEDDVHERIWDEFCVQS